MEHNCLPKWQLCGRYSSVGGAWAGQFLSLMFIDSCTNNGSVCEVLYKIKQPLHMRARVASLSNPLGLRRVVCGVVVLFIVLLWHVMQRV